MSKISVDEITDEAGTGAPDFPNGATFGDNDKIIMGADSDLQIYHDGSNSYVAEGGTGDLILQGAGQLHLKNSDNDEYYVICNDDGAVQIRHDNATKLATTSTGCDITGTLNADALTGIGSIDATTKNAIEAAGVGGLTTLVAENAAFGTGNLVKIPLGNYKTQTFYFNNIHASAATSLVGRTTDSNDNVITANNTYFNTNQSGSSDPNNRMTGYSVFDVATSGGNIDTHLTVRVVDAYSSTLQTMMYIHYGQTEAQNRTGYPDFFQTYQTFTRMRYVERNQSLVFTFGGANPTFNSGITYTSYGVA